ncbi:MAG: cytochrome c oxidase subunit II [Planctomycetota bacterium]
MWQNLPLFPESASTTSGEIDALYLYLVAVTAFFAILILVLVVGFAVYFRRRPNGPPVVQIEGSLRLELVWTIIPFLIALSFFWWGSDLFLRTSRAPRDATDVYVVGKQWMWKLQHANGKREINELHVPVGQRIRLTMTSEDVIHAFFVPAFRMKRDVMPGRYTQAWFEATKTGVYHLFCAEYCGTEHSKMIGQVYVMEPEEYAAWLAGATSGETPEAAGKTLFESYRCDSCHRDAPDARGPSLNGVFGSEVVLLGGGRATADETYLRESILAPASKIVAGFQPVMPTYAGQLGEEQILQLIAYIKTLKSGQAQSAR